MLLTGCPVVVMFEATSYAVTVMSHIKQAVYMELVNCRQLISVMSECRSVAQHNLRVPLKNEKHP